jgi:hypothetical protein
MDHSDTSSDSPKSIAAEETLRPTYAPVAMALGIAMFFWGFMALSLNTNALWFMSTAGAGLMIWALRSWIREIVLQWESSR